MSLPAKPRAITFDVGGTLLKPWPSVGQVYADIAAKFGKTLEPAVLNYRFGAAWRAAKNFNYRRAEWQAVVGQTFSGLWEDAPEEFFPQLYDRFAEPAAWRVFDDALPTLDLLAASGQKLAIISNWDERLRPLLEKIGLATYFETIIISCEVGFTKPSPVIFEHAAKRLGLPPETILHVGDSQECDVAGAQAAGYQSILLDRAAEEEKPGMIKTLWQLEKAL